MAGQRRARGGRGRPGVPQTTQIRHVWDKHDKTQTDSTQIRHFRDTGRSARVAAGRAGGSRKNTQIRQFGDNRPPEGGRKPHKYNNFRTKRTIWAHNVHTWGIFRSWRPAAAPSPSKTCLICVFSGAPGRRSLQPPSMHFSAGACCGDVRLFIAPGCKDAQSVERCGP